jgi:hypothetical protein
MKIKHVLECQFGEWYPQFKHITIESEIIPLESEFLSWIRDAKFLTTDEEFPVRAKKSVYDDPDSNFTAAELNNTSNTPSDV